MSNRHIFEAFSAALGRGDMNAQIALLHPDFVVHEAASLPYGGDYRGAEGWAALVGAVVQAWSGFRLEPLGVIAEDKGVMVVKFNVSGRSRSSGRSFNMPVAEIWRIEDGKLLDISPFYWDTHVLATLHGTDDPQGV